MPNKYKEYIETPIATSTITPKITSQTLNTKHILTTNINAIYEEVSTAEQMDIYLADSTNVGKMYKYTGETCTKYFHNSLYICTPKTVYTITPTLSNVVGDASNPTSIEEDATVSLIFSASTGYHLPDSIIVTGASYVWNKSTGTLTISDPTTNISISIIGEINVYTISTILTHITGDASNPTTITHGTTASLVFSSETHYYLPETITVTGTDYTWTKSTGTLVLNNPTSDINVSIAGEPETYAITTTLSHAVGDSSNPTEIAYGTTTSLIFTNEVGYALPGTITVSSGCTYTWNRTTGTLTLSGVTEAISISITGYELLCFTANTAGSTISMSGITSPTLEQNFSYSTDSRTWNTFTPGTTSVTLAAQNDKVYFKGNNPNGVSESFSNFYRFVLTGSIAASGSIMCLIDDGAHTATAIPNTTCFYRLFFGASALTSAPELPATTLTTYCYEGMFTGCSGLTAAPALPATTLASNCYQQMFENCTTITMSPALLATTLASSCYSGMFNGCTSLTVPPVLPATTLAATCYNCMFMGCTSLAYVPALPATTLATYSYQNMFNGCTALYVSDTSSTECSYAWTIPSSGTFTNTYSQSGMFTNCLGTRSSDSMAGAAGASYTYYTQNTPV